uniref:DNA replication licensing factor MCM3 n=1 Tax=Callorhinchus milii TaxID=7868 RepID=A0A4W3HAC9_CALMI
MISDNTYRLIVSINDLRRKNEKRAKLLLNNSFEELLAFQRALKDFVASIDATYAKQFEEFYIGLEGSFGSKHLTPRKLTSAFLSNLVCVEGIVVKCSLVRPKVVRSVHYCPATKKSIERRYTDLTSLQAFPSTAIYPIKDEENNPLETEFGLSTYKDHQTITMQEMPEKAPAGQLPRSVDIILDDDLVDAVKPGDRVQVIGSYRCLPGKKNGYTSGTFRTIVLGCNVKLLSKEVAPMFSADDVAQIKKFSKSRSKDIFEQLARSLAPSIHGHQYIKQAILCLLLGGTEKLLDNGSRIRGDINILLMGEFPPYLPSPHTQLPPYLPSPHTQLPPYLPSPHTQLPPYLPSPHTQINGSFSDWRDVTTGVPQGSVLGPQLFTIYINDLDEDIKVNISKFADDTKLRGSANTEDDIKKTQRDIDRLGDWAGRWDMKYNVGK